MEAARFGPAWASLRLETCRGLQEGPFRHLLEAGDTEQSLLNTSLTYPYLFHPQTFLFKSPGKLVFPQGWKGCGVRSLKSALGISLLWEITEHINRARVEKDSGIQLGHIKGAIVLQDTVLREHPTLKELGFEIVQPQWIEFYRALFDILWAGINYETQNMDVVVIAGRAFKQISDMKLDREATSAAQNIFRYCLIYYLLKVKRLPWSEDVGEVQAVGQSSKLGRKLTMLLPKGSKLAKEATDSFERTRRIGWENEAKATCEELTAQLNEWITNNFDNHMVDMPSKEILQ